MKILVVLEQRQGVLKSASAAVWQTTQHLARSSADAVVEGVVMGPVDVQSVKEQCRGNGILYHIADTAYDTYSPQGYTEAVTEIANRSGAEILMIAETAMGRDLAPRVALRLEASLVSDCIVDVDDTGSLRARTTMYSGTVSAIAEEKRKKAVYMLAPEALDRAAIAENDVTIQEVSVSGISKSNPFLRELVFNTRKKDITESDIVVAGGRGIGSSTGFAMLESLADVLGGTVGASRSAVDEGWRPHSDQVGQTGRTIAPRLYIACGISGAPQHLAGIAGAGTIVAINRDPDAPIFKASDYGIVGDIEEVVPDLERAVRALKE